MRGDKAREKKKQIKVRWSEMISMKKRKEETKSEGKMESEEAEKR